MREKIEEVLEKEIRPALAAHGGGVELVDIDNNRVYVRLQGGCKGCAGARATLKGGIERILRQRFPEIVEVIDFTDLHN